MQGEATRRPAPPWARLLYNPAAMHWSEPLPANPGHPSPIVIESLREHEVWHATYVPDAINWQVLAKLQADPAFTVVPASREEEAVGIAAGVYAGGGRAAMFMQSSGFGNTINGLAQLLIAYRIPVPLFIGMRGVWNWESSTRSSRACASTSVWHATYVPDAINWHLQRADQCSPSC